MEMTELYDDCDGCSAGVRCIKTEGLQNYQTAQEELAAAGYMTVQAKVPRTYWCERFYTGKRNAG